MTTWFKNRLHPFKKKNQVNDKGESLKVKGERLPGPTHPICASLDHPLSGFAAKRVRKEYGIKRKPLFPPKAKRGVSSDSDDGVSLRNLTLFQILPVSGNSVLSF